MPEGRLFTMLDELIEVAEEEGQRNLAAVLCFAEAALDIGEEVLQAMAEACYEIARRAVAKALDRHGPVQ